MDTLEQQIKDAYAAGQRFFHISGMIGSGKSTLIQKMEVRLKQRGYDVSSHLEPIRNEVLMKYLEDPKTYATILQETFLADRMVMDANVRFNHMLHPDRLFLMERGCLENSLFIEQNRACGYISDANATDMLTQTAPQCRNERTRAHVFVYAPIGTCIRRMLRRDREGEADAYTKSTEDAAARSPDPYFSSLFERWGTWSEQMQNECPTTFAFDNSPNTPELAGSTQNV